MVLSTETQDLRKHPAKSCKDHGVLRLIGGAVGGDDRP